MITYTWCCAAREDEGSIVVDIAWADGHSAIGLYALDMLPRGPYSRALMQVRYMGMPSSSCFLLATCSVERCMRRAVLS